MEVFIDLIRSFDLRADGALYMWTILFLMVIFILHFLKQFWFYKQIADVHADRFLLKIRLLLGESRFDEALAICNSAGTRGLPQIVSVALENRQLELPHLKAQIEGKVIQLISRIEKGNHYFSTLGNTATLLGLMGTIYGLIIAFAAVGQPGVSAALKTSMLASGISAAMNTTLLGLILAVPCMMAYSYFQTTCQRLVENFDRQASSVLNLLMSQDAKFKNYKPSQRRVKKNREEGLDITPIMGLMVTLIPLLLSSAEFVKLGAIEMQLPKAGKSISAVQDQAPADKPLKLGLGLLITNKGIYIQNELTNSKAEAWEDSNSHPDSDKPQIARQGSEYDYKALIKALVDIKEKATRAYITTYTGQEPDPVSLYKLLVQTQDLDVTQAVHYKDYESIKIVAQENIHFQTIINVMDASRETQIDGSHVILFPVVSMGKGVKSAF